MTCHFIEGTYERKSYVLSCQRVKRDHNYLNIMEVLTEIMKKFKIDVSKITHMVTDNARNFEKLFKIFSSSSLPATHQANLSRIGNLHEEDDLSSSSSDNEVDSKDSGIEITNTESMFLSIINSEMCLPYFRHMKMKYCAHTLNLIATYDVSKISDDNYFKISKSTFNKFSSFWDLVSKAGQVNEFF